MSIVQIIAFRIKEIKEYRKLTQKNMADELDIVERSYANIENGKTDPSLSRLSKIAALLDVELNDLLNIHKPVEELMAESYMKKKNPPPPQILRNSFRKPTLLRQM